MHEEDLFDNQRSRKISHNYNKRKYRKHNSSRPSTRPMYRESSSEYDGYCNETPMIECDEIGIETVTRAESLITNDSFNDFNESCNGCTTNTQTCSDYVSNENPVLSNHIRSDIESSSNDNWSVNGDVSDEEFASDKVSQVEYESNMGFENNNVVHLKEIVKWVHIKEITNVSISNNNNNKLF